MKICRCLGTNYYTPSFGASKSNWSCFCRQMKFIPDLYTRYLTDVLKWFLWSGQIFIIRWLWIVALFKHRILFMWNGFSAFIHVHVTNNQHYLQQHIHKEVVNSIAYGFISCNTWVLFIPSKLWIQFNKKVIIHEIYWIGMYLGSSCIFNIKNLYTVTWTSKESVSYSQVSK